MPGKVDQRMAAAICMLGNATAHQLGGLEVRGIHIWDCWSWRGRTADGRVDIPSWIPDEKLTTYLIATLAGQEAEARWLMLRHGYSLAAARKKARSESAGGLVNFREFSVGTGLTEDEARHRAAALVEAHFDRIEAQAPQLARDGYLPAAL